MGLRPQWMQPSLLFSISLLFLLVRVALKLRSLRFHSLSRVHDFHCNAANPSQNGTLRHADINLVLSQRAQEKIDKYQAGYAAQGIRGTSDCWR